MIYGVFFKLHIYKYRYMHLTNIKPFVYDDKYSVLKTIKEQIGLKFLPVALKKATLYIERLSLIIKLIHPDYCRKNDILKKYMN